jgi:hypothetical protein
MAAGTTTAATIMGAMAATMETAVMAITATTVKILIVELFCSVRQLDVKIEPN